MDSYKPSYKNPYTHSYKPSYKPPYQTFYLQLIYDARSPFYHAIIGSIIRINEVSGPDYVYTDVRNIVRDYVYRYDDIHLLVMITDYLAQFQKKAQLISREQDRADIIHELTNLYIQTKNFTVKSYLDYGCGNGTITSCIGTYFGLAPDHIYGVDVIASSSDKITYIRGAPHNIPSGSIDCITAFVSLHHLGNKLDAVLSEIARMLRPGGIFIIREHDYNNTDTMRAYLNLIHMCFDIYNTGSCNVNDLRENTRYKSYHNWNILMHKYGFILQKTIYYPGKNLQRLYHALYLLEN
jgi:SAM-dependent methyltransferase